MNLIIIAHLMRRTWEEMWEQKVRHFKNPPPKVATTFLDLRIFKNTLLSLLCKSPLPINPFSPKNYQKLDHLWPTTAYQPPLSPPLRSFILYIFHFHYPFITILFTPQKWLTKPKHFTCFYIYIYSLSTLTLHLSLNIFPFYIKTSYVPIYISFLYYLFPYGWQVLRRGRQVRQSNL